MKSSSPNRLPSYLSSSWRIGIVHSSFYETEIQAMIDSACAVLSEAKIPASRITLHPVAGSFEVPLIGAALCEAKKVDALIGLGIIVEGETQHASLLAAETARGIMDVQLRYQMPFSFEILYVKNLEQARARGDKGAEAAYAALHSLAELHRIHS